MEHDHTAESRDSSPWWRTRGGTAFAAMAAVALFFLLAEHRAHLLGALPYLLILLCPLMHLLHHGRGHGSGHSHADKEQP